MMRKIIARVVRKRKAAEVETLVGHVKVGGRGIEGRGPDLGDNNDGDKEEEGPIKVVI